MEHVVQALILPGPLQGDKIPGLSHYTNDTVIPAGIGACMSAALDNVSVVQHNDLIGVPNSFQPMGNHCLLYTSRCV